METRFPLQTPTPDLEVFSFWTIAIFITPKRYESLLKMKHVRVTLCLLLQYTYLLALPLECKLIFLPPYSPDLNPIEQAFSSIKSYLRRYWQDQTFSIMDRACQNINSEKAWAFFRASGYVV
jgi:transposase